MCSSDYKERFIAELYQLKLRMDSLHKTITKYKEKRLDFDLSCPISLLEKQLKVMVEYYGVLVDRAKIENINIEKEISTMLSKDGNYCDTPDNIIKKEEGSDENEVI